AQFETHQPLAGFIDAARRLVVGIVFELVTLLAALRVSGKEFSGISRRVPGRVLHERRSAARLILVERITVAAPAAGGDAGAKLRQKFAENDKVTELTVDILIDALPIFAERRREVSQGDLHRHLM